MPKHNFVDYVKLYLRSGRGGAGCASFRREKFVPQGGPDGGDGGDGGGIVLRGNAQYWTLLDLKYRKFIHAPNGEPGKGARKNGRRGEDLMFEVPLGTVARDADTDEELAEIEADGQQVCILRGGRGGLGNWHFRSATNHAPEYAQPGTEGEERVVILELKLLADVGLVGFPNAGKSTLLSVLTDAKPEIADYPFTTLTPNLGIVRYRDFRSFVMADIPGIIEGASEGRGLGVQFLRHIERNAVLLFLVPIDTADVVHEYGVLRQELRNYSPELERTPHLLAISKCDLADAERLAEVEAELKAAELDALFFSSAAQQGLDALKDQLWQLLLEANPPTEAAAERPWRPAP